MQITRSASFYTSPLRTNSEPTPPPAQDPPAPPPPEDGKGPIEDWFNGLPKWPRAAVYGLGTLTPATLGGFAGSSVAGLAGAIPGALLGGLVTFGFQKGIGADNREAIYKAGLGALAGAFFSGMGNAGLTPLTAGLAVALGAFGGIYAQTRQDLGA
ncbi:MAG: hypothetical protein HY319_32560 [Armatimonadetes bacterium]|nr:hypothetical protein [Armatimonadota bacterium]